MMKSTFINKTGFNFARIIKNIYYLTLLHFFTFVILLIAAVFIIGCGNGFKVLLDAQQTDSPYVAVTGVTLNKTSATILVDGTLQLIPAITPSNATSKNVVWSTNNASVATVNSNGLVTGISVDDTTIFVTTEDGSFTAKCDVVVSDDPVAVTGISLDKTSSTIVEGGIVQLNPTVTPSNATNQNVTWSSSANGVATVSSSGLVTGGSAGSATITVTTADGNFTATCAVTVTTASVAVTGVSLDKTSSTIVEGGTVQLNPTITPSNATNQNVTWSSSANGVATVSSSGLVTGGSAGSATITVTTADGNFTATCTVTVTTVSVAVTGVSINKTSATIYIGETVQLVSTINPSNATNQNVTWSSNATGVATVGSGGIVSGVALGAATITVTTVDGNFTETCDITVANVIFWTEADGTINRIYTNSAGESTVRASTGMPLDIALYIHGGAGNKIYWTEYTGTTYALNYANFDGSSNMLFHGFPVSAGFGPSAIAIDSANAIIYWNQYGTASSQNDIWRSAISSYSAVKWVNSLWPEYLYGICLDNINRIMYVISNSYWDVTTLLGSGNTSVGCYADMDIINTKNSPLYITGGLDPSIHLRGIAVDPGGYVYYAQDDSIVRASLTLQGSSTWITTAGSEVGKLALDLGARKIYWLSDTDKAIYCANLDDATPVAEGFVTDLDSTPTGIAITQ